MSLEVYKGQVDGRTGVKIFSHQLTKRAAGKELFSLVWSAAVLLFDHGYTNTRKGREK